MNRFVKYFIKLHTDDLVDKINEYAEENNLEIISVISGGDMYKAIVLFEGEKPRI
jgi:hypothetical protein